MAFENGQNTACNDKRSRDTYGCGYGSERVKESYVQSAGMRTAVGPQSDEVMGGFRRVTETVCDGRLPTIYEDGNGAVVYVDQDITKQDEIEGHGYGEWSGDGRTVGE